MLYFLFLIPALAVLSGVFVYRHTGKRHILRMDLVQFFYAFILSPLLFIWAKSFLYFLLRNELGIRLTSGELFFFDTTLSVFVLYLYAFVVIHSLTKTFELNLKRDPLYDLFAHSEYYHIWLSHVVVYIGGMVLATVISLTNAFIPWEIPISKTALYLATSGGLITGGAVFVGFWFTRLNNGNLMRLIKLVMGFCLLIHLTAYFIFDIAFSGKYIMYWFFFAAFLSTSTIAFAAEKPVRKGFSLVRKLRSTKR